MDARLAALVVYPLKSAAGLGLDFADVGVRGLAGDRCWMLVDAEGHFITGRQCPRLTLLRTRALADGGLEVTGLDGEVLRVPAPDGGVRLRSAVWGDPVDAADAGDVAALWFSNVLEQPVRLLHADAAMQRPLDPDYARAGDETAFADGYPLLLLSRSACDALSERVGRDLGWRRFRPNLLVDGVPPHAEDDWRRIRVGEVEFEVVKACVRCVFTTIDPDRGLPEADGEPLRTLKTYRRGQRGITFGQNLIPRGRGSVRVGDVVEVLD